jgi:hypothetical protein
MQVNRCGDGRRRRHNGSDDPDVLLETKSDEKGTAILARSLLILRVSKSGGSSRQISNRERQHQPGYTRCDEADPNQSPNNPCTVVWPVHPQKTP